MHRNGNVLVYLFILALYFIYNLKDIEAIKSLDQQWYSDALEEAKLVKAVQQSMVEWKARSSRNRFKRAESRVCYGDLGCFEDAGPFGYFDMLPASPEEIDTKFLVFSSKNRSGETPFHEFAFREIAPNISESSTPTDPEERRNLSAPVYEKLGKTKYNSVRVIVHGFGSSCPHVWVYELMSALMAVDDCLVMCVDWENGATLPNYVRAATNTQLVGRQIAIVLKDLADHNQLELSKVHIIGFSLGAHVAGFAGSLLPGLRRITGLDPAGPLFEAQHPKARLDESDASYVDVIHSNGQNLILGGLGAWQQMGHVDFYPNGGRGQHGCSNLFIGAVTDIIWAVPPTETEGRSLCNHRRAYKFFIDSVAPNCQFPAFPCDSYEDFVKGECFGCDSNSVDSNGGSTCGNMGYYADKSSGRGILYLKTREEEPFCAHQYRIRVHSALHDLPLRTLGRLQATLTSEGGLSEKFMITERDDAEMHAGEVISQIIVPHPALGFPTNISLLYTEYKGWLTRGLATWSINKFVMSDSYGKTYSICKHLILQSGKRIELKLKPGDCKAAAEESEEEISDEFKHIFEDDDDSTSSTTSTTTDSALPVTDKTEFSVDSTTTTFTTSTEVNVKTEISAITDSWKPIIPQRSEHKTEKPRIVEPLVVVKPKREAALTTTTNQPEIQTVRQNNKRSFEIPALSNSVTSVAMIQEINDNKNTTNTTEHKPVMVQLFPYRIASMFEKAERYARQTILPYLTEQFPNFFKKTIDLYDDNDTNIIEDSKFIVDTFDTVKPEKRAFREPIHSSRRTLPKGKDYIRQYRNLSGVQHVFATAQDDSTESDVSKIDLPTYRPSKPTITTRKPKYIPLNRN